MRASDLTFFFFTPLVLLYLLPCPFSSPVSNPTPPKLKNSSSLIVPPVLQGCVSLFPPPEPEQRRSLCCAAVIGPSGLTCVAHPETDTRAQFRSPVENGRGLLLSAEPQITNTIYSGGGGGGGGVVTEK